MTNSYVRPKSFVPAPSTMACFVDNTQFPWMEVALNEFYTSELAGHNRNNPRILEYHSASRGHATDDETSWCSSFVNWVMREIGVQGTGRANARSWRNWGNPIPLAAPQYGAVTVLWRESPSSWKGHVGFFAGIERGRLILLGGNQGDAVSLRPYPRSHLLDFRWPPGFPPPNRSVSI
jgi:uncharacterized protein (TIGR02594 family)